LARRRCGRRGIVDIDHDTAAAAAPAAAGAGATAAAAAAIAAARSGGGADHRDIARRRTAATEKAAEEAAAAKAAAKTRTAAKAAAPAATRPAATRNRGKRGKRGRHIGDLRNRRAFGRIKIGLDRADRHRSSTASTHRLTFDRPLDNPAAALFRHRDLALTRLDVARASNRIDLDQLAVDIGRIIRGVGAHWLRHAHSAALQQSYARSSGGKLRDGQFERHSSNLVCLW
jgi:hypothetical protein